MISPEAVVTLDRPDGFRVVRRLGRASAEVQRPPNLWRALGRSFGLLLGIGHPEAPGEAARVREECLAQLRDRADALGANGVVGLRFDAVEEADGSVRVTAVGEAVVLERETSAR